MQALVYRGPEILALEEIDRPACQPNEVLVQVESVGICGSELEGYRGHSSVRTPPLVMGHEFCGRIAETGKNVSGLAAGDKVVVNPLIPCRHCPNCSSGKFNVCLNRRIIGIHRPGAFAEFVAVPADSVHAVPQNMEPALASLAEPLAVAIRAVKRALRPLDDLLIYGAGPIGLLSLLAARQMGAGTVAVLDLQPSRLGHASKLGAVALQPDQLAIKRQEIFPRGIPAIVDCVGVQATREHAMEAVDPDGTIVMAGLGHERSDLPVNRLVRQEISLIGTYTYSPEEFGQAVELLKQGRIDTRGWSDTRSLAEGPAAFEELVRGTGDFSKIFLQP